MADDPAKNQKNPETRRNNESLRGVVPSNQSVQDGQERADANETETNLQRFIIDQHRRQKLDNPNEEIDEERINSFFARALTESHRMNAEANKSQKKRENLHSELGKEVFEAWTDEHAAETIQQSRP